MGFAEDLGIMYCMRTTKGGHWIIAAPIRLPRKVRFDNILLLLNKLWQIDIFETNAFCRLLKLIQVCVCFDWM